MSKLKELAVALTLAIAGVFAAACSAPLPVEELHGDYLAYDEETLVADATLIVEATVVDTEGTLLMPPVEKGAPKEAIERARADAIPATFVTVRVDVVHKGDVDAEFVITQTGGVKDGVMYRSDMEPLLVKKESYLLFVRAGIPDGFAILGGCAGMFRAGGDGTFEAVKPDSAPFSRLTRAEVEGLV